MKKIILKLIIIILIIGAGYFVWSKTSVQPNIIVCTQEAKLCPDGSAVGRTGPSCEFAACPGYALGLEYKNNDYGFSVSLPDSWTGYNVSASKWIGDALDAKGQNQEFASGPFISIHSPKWTGPGSYQDIPIWVFTLSQWTEIQNETFHIGAAPIPPSELGRNAKYVFALPARYDYAFPTGYQEVEQIIQSKPLHAF